MKIKTAWILPAVSVLAMTMAAQAPASPAVPDSLVDGFDNPPAGARPRVWWHWMNGNVTHEGIQLDLEWMARVGIGGFQNFDASLHTPQVVDKRLVYMTPEWKDAFRFAVEKADSLGLEVAIAASPGWSETGGPWVAPEDGMKKLVWSELDLQGGTRFAGRLPAPPATTGPFQDVALPAASLLGDEGAKSVPTLYRDAVVLAYRLPRAEQALPVPRVSTASGPIDAAALFDRSYAAVSPIAGEGTNPPWLRFDYARAQRIRSASLAMVPGMMFAPLQFDPVLEASPDGQTFREVARFPGQLGAQLTISFPEITAQSLRIVFRPAGGNPLAGAAFVPAEGVAPPPWAALMGRGDNAAKVLEVGFSAAARVDRFEDKAGFSIAESYHELATTADVGESTVPTRDIVDLSKRMKPDGTLDWRVPAGTWRVLRMGYSLLGKENHPATPEATGLEVDKYDADAVRRYLNTYLDMYLDTVGPGLIGAKGIRAVLNDSIEVGPSNWTTRIVEEFKARRGYDPLRWLPALTGVIVESPAKSDAFLYDFRRTLAELVADNHYRVITAELHKRDLIHYSEALESGRPTLGDDIDIRRDADIPMAAMWSYAKGDIGPKAAYWADIRGAASVAHVYGQNIVAAESLTSGMAPWAHSPRDLQPMIDMEFALGVNRPVIHTSVHQPITEKAPGLSLMIFGQYFTRLETWAEQAKPWVSYIARNAYMLQQGRHVADVAYFYGEEAPLVALFGKTPPADVPSGAGFDYINADVVLNQLRNDGDAVVTSGGARYRVIYLGGTSRQMSLPVLKRLDELVRAGATLVGEKPAGSPMLNDDARRFARLADALWGGSTGRGRVIATNQIDTALATLGVVPDFATTRPQADTTVMFLHRRTADADIYFFTNRRARAESVEFSFRGTGRRPELWDAASGSRRALGYRFENARTVVPMQLGAHQSGFVVFREATNAPSATQAEPVVTRTTAVTGPWQLRFQPGRGAPDEPVQAEAGDWSASANAGIRYFSGTATYSRRIELKELDPGNALVLDLGEVHELAEVVVNGRSAGIAWKPPYRVDVTGLLQTGSNTIEVRVTNLWVNRLIGDEQPGASRITFTAMPTWRADAPLRASGLIGPVRLEELALAR